MESKVKDENYYLKFRESVPENIRQMAELTFMRLTEGTELEVELTKDINDKDIKSIE